MSLLYDGSQNSPLLSAARSSRRTRMLFGGMVLMGMVVLALWGGAAAAAGKGATLIVLVWLAGGLAVYPIQQRAHRQGRLAEFIAISYAWDTLLLGLLVLRLGGSEWLSALTFCTIAAVAGLFVPPRQLRWVLGYAVVVHCGIVFLPHLGLMPVALDGPYQMEARGGPGSVADVMALGVLLLLSFIVQRKAQAVALRENELRMVNQRLQTVNDALHDQQFRLLVGQQDLLMANERLRLKNEEVLKSQDVIQSLAEALEARDPYTQGHSKRVAETAVMLARELGLSRDEQEIVKHGCLLHDIGKIHVPDQVLRKPGALDEAEMSLMRRHPSVGEQICRHLAFARIFLAIIRHHHERWDGGGYPDGLKGEEISLHARITAIADAWDAMTTDRPYRQALPESVARRRMQEGAGSQWDPKLIRTFLSLMERLQKEALDGAPKNPPQELL